MNIYQDFIIPIFENAEKKSSIYFISPSTFFGYYSLGGKNFELSCDAIEKAKKRGVNIKIIVDVKDSFSAKAAEGILSFLNEGTELRNKGNNLHNYWILYIDENSGKRIECFSDKPKQTKFLPGIQVRQFNPKIEEMNDLSNERIDNYLQSFNQVWDASDKNIRRIIYRYLPLYESNKSLRIAVMIIPFLVFILGFVFALILVWDKLFILYNEQLINGIGEEKVNLISNNLRLIQILTNLFFSLLIGVSSSIIANKLSKRN